MALPLNANAQQFVRNPYPYNLYYPFPFYFQFYQAPQLTSFVYTSPLPPPFYHYYFPSNYVSFLSASPLPSSQPKCLIEEINSDKSDAEEVDERRVKPKALVRNFNRSVVSRARRFVDFVGRCHPQKKRASVKVSHEDFAFKGEVQGWTTVMIKNLPNKFNKEKMISLLDKHCREENQKVVSLGEEKEDGEPLLSEYDFFYLPIDFKSNSNYGYAFVNFTTARAAVILHKYLHGHSWEYLGSQKICKVNYARIQGLADLILHSRNSYYACDSDEFLPVRFEPPRSGYNVSTEYLMGKRISF